MASVTVLSYDYKTKQSVSINVPSKFPIGGKNAQSVESFDCPGQYFYTGAREARRYGELRMEGHEALSFVWQGGRRSVPCGPARGLPSTTSR